MTIRLTTVDGAVPWPRPIPMIEGPPDPELSAEFEAFRRNSRWISQHWGDFLPHGLGRHVVVANQQGTLVDSVEEALAWLKEHHPDDPGPFIQYLLPDDGPRIRGNRGCSVMAGHEGVFLSTGGGAIRP